MHAELFGDPGRGEGGIVVQELRDARREQIAGDLVTGARRTAPAAAAGAAGRGGVVAYDVAGPVLDSAHEHQVLAHGRILLPAVPGGRVHPAQRSGLLTVQQVIVIVRRRQLRDWATGKVGVDLLAAVKPGPARTQRRGETLGPETTRVDQGLHSNALLRGNVGEGAHQVPASSADHVWVLPIRPTTGFPGTDATR
ncbi:hypothetical protein ACWGJ0_40105 [Streptomyces massasporeus]